jgi:hypothetical protein
MKILQWEKLEKSIYHNKKIMPSGKFTSGAGQKFKFEVKKYLMDITDDNDIKDKIKKSKTLYKEDYIKFKNQIIQSDRIRTKLNEEKIKDVEDAKKYRKVNRLISLGTKNGINENRINIAHRIKNTVKLNRLNFQKLENSILNRQIYENIYMLDIEDRIVINGITQDFVRDDIYNQLKIDLSNKSKKRLSLVVKIYLSSRPDGDVKQIKILFNGYYYKNIEVIKDEITKNINSIQNIIAVADQNQIKNINSIQNQIKENEENEEPTGYQLFFAGFSFFTVNLPIKGGCQHKNNSKFYNKKIGNKFYNITNPTSQHNNCLFSCMNIITKNKTEISTIRKELNFEYNKMISINDVEKISEYYKYTINLYCNITGHKIKTFGDYENSCNIGMSTHHYVILEETDEIKEKMCNKCLQPYKFKHTCNQSNIDYMKGNQEIKPNKKIGKYNDNMDFNNMIFFDLETFINEKQIAQVYAAGWYVDGEYKVADGENSFGIFVDDILKYKNKYLCAYNGAKFDFHFLLKELIKRDVKIGNFMPNNGRILSFVYGEGNKIFDLCLFTQAPLKKVCEEFKLDVQKGDFEHDLMKSYDDCNKYRNLYLPYLEKDVLSLRELFIKFQNMMFDIFKVYITDFLTLSSMAYGIWTITIKDSIILPNKEEYNFIKKSIYGGRTYPRQKEYISKYYDEIIENKDDTKKIKEIYDKIDDYIFNGDITSLYPTAMKFNYYPVGESRWIEINKEYYDDLDIGIYDITFKVNKDLFEPILPKHSGNGGLHWDLIDGEGIYALPDIQNAVKHGYKIFIKKGLVWDKSEKIFEEYIERCYKIKEENDDNPILRSIGKLLLNGLYGKMLQGARFDNSELCNNYNQVLYFMEKNDYADHIFIDSKIILFGKSKNYLHNSKITKPAHLGSFVLSYSRDKMIRTFECINPKLDDLIFTYTDTDSLHIHCKNIKKLEENDIMKVGLGMVSNDCKNNGKIIYEKNLAPKLYMYYYINDKGEFKTVMKSKGIPNRLLHENLYLKDMVEELNIKNSFKKISMRKIDIKEGDKIITTKNDVSYFDIAQVNSTRTFNKTSWTGMSLEDNIFYAYNEE